MTTIAMDESGNTQPIIAIGLVAIPDNEISVINSLLSLKQTDPKEIRVLYEKKSEGEFKYADLRNAYRQTRLEVFDDFLRSKLAEISRLNVQVYLSVFPNTDDNSERLKRLVHEAQDLLMKWAHQNPAEAFSKDLEIIVDQQVFPETYIFQYYSWRGRFWCNLIPKRLIEAGETKKVHTDRENIMQILDANSKSYRCIQLTDILVGCAREHYALKRSEYYSIIQNLFKKEHVRAQLISYTYSERGFLSYGELKKW